MAATAIFLMTGCNADHGKAEKASAEIQVFVANSLNDVILELADIYKETHPEVKIIPNALGSQELRQQIESGIPVICSFQQIWIRWRNWIKIRIRIIFRMEAS